MTTDPEQAAQALVDGRMASIRALVAARAEVEAQREKLAAAETEDARLYRAALRDGWTEAELRKVGLAKPAKDRRVQRRANSAGKSEQ